MPVKFIDNSIQVKEALSNAVTAYLHEVAGEVQSQVVRNTRVDSGELASKWEYKVDADKGEATIGNPQDNAIWEEFGTGEYALKGNGRKGGWYVHESKLSSKAKSRMRRIEIDGKVFYFTRGKTPSRAFHNAYTSKKSFVIKRAEQVIGAKMNE